jgi:hypothetical protein
MKKYLVLLSVVLVCYTAKAQFTFGIDGGLSVPGRGYGSSSDASFSNPSSGTINGYAKIGTCYDAYAGFKFIPILGIMAQYGVNFNSYDVGKLNNSSETVTTSGGQEISSYLVGPYLSFGAAGIKLEVKLLGGIVSSSYPTITESSTFNGTYNLVVNSFQTGDNFGYCAGAKVKFMAAKIIGIGIGVDYLASDATFKGSSTGYNTNVSQNYNMSVGVFQATLGLSLDF